MFWCAPRGGEGPAAARSPQAAQRPGREPAARAFTARPMAWCPMMHCCSCRRAPCALQVPGGAPGTWLPSLQSGSLSAFAYDEPLLTYIDRQTDCSITWA